MHCKGILTLFCTKRNTEEIDAGIMRELVRKIVVYPDNVIHIDWNFDKELLSKVIDKIIVHGPEEIEVIWKSDDIFKMQYA